MDLFMEENRLLNLCAGMRELCRQEEERLAHIEQIIYSLGADWQGEAEKEYTGRFFVVKKEYEGIITELKKYEKSLRNMVSDYIEIESKYAALIQAI